MRVLPVFLIASALMPVTFAQAFRIPVVVELFTSEGCSSCPAADQVLQRLARTQPVTNARIIPLEEHVDYWNSAAWADPFSAPLYRVRQNDYAHVFRTESIYTPQMVVNGRSEFVGSEGNQAIREIGYAATKVPALARVRWTANSTDSHALDLWVTLRSSRPNGGQLANCDVYLAITEDDLVSKVHGGENAGRTLAHTGVVRSFGKIGEWKSNVQLELRPAIKLPEDWRREQLHAVVFAQEQDSRRIIAADSTPLR